MTTIKEQLQNISNSNTSSLDDEKFIKIVLNRLGFNNAIVTYGIVYIEGIGTLKNPPTSINAIAKSILNALNQNKPNKPNINLI
jgi:hypothetical protein